MLPGQQAEGPTQGYRRANAGLPQGQRAYYGMHLVLLIAIAIVSVCAGRHTVQDSLGIK
jgi:hypothetical protein